MREALDTIHGSTTMSTGFRARGFLFSPIRSNAHFQVNYLAGKRQGTSEMRVTSGSISSINSNGGAATGMGTGTVGPSTTTTAQQSSHISTNSDSDFWADLNTALHAIVGAEGGRQIIVNPHSGMIVVRGLPTDIRNVESYLRSTQLIVERQVMLEAKIIEVQLNDNFSSGVNWAAFGTHFSAGPLTPGTLLQTPALVTPGLASTPGSSLASAAANLGACLAWRSRPANSLPCCGFWRRRETCKFFPARAST